ncbi:hypothetical protein IHN63_02790 [Deinococcus sp. 6YEL10]|uniref:hypothetical protein n=1 Tax=Deinococcus sp. 6YEL10 TaxID=2745870 RepID=UPI001E4C4585|nr:hypothetical protein [Deinococcus sp. 6YEL10]MCD0160226.1 hypothetical protein [Deinococcus sp. 6YEL10]
MEFQIAGTPARDANFGRVLAGQSGPTITAQLVNTGAAPRAVQLRLRQDDATAGTGAASVTLAGVPTPLGEDWLDCGTLAPGAALTLSCSWFTASGAPAGQYRAEDLAFVEADVT